MWKRTKIEICSKVFVLLKKSHYIVWYYVILPYAFSPYADSQQSIRHSQFAICPSSPYAPVRYMPIRHIDDDFIAYLT